MNFVGRILALSALFVLVSAHIDRKWEEVTIPVPWGHVAGKWYGDRDKQPVLALHGREDNAGTFDRLIPLLPKTIPVFAIDFPGHGRSSHFPPGVQYHLFWDFVPVVRRIVKHFGWEKVSLMGHSLGGAVCFMYAASFPDEVAQYISIDLYGPTIRNVKKLAAMTGSNIDDVLKFEMNPKQPSYPYDDIVSRAMKGYNAISSIPIDQKSAETLLIRGMNVVPKKFFQNEYSFSRDVRLRKSFLATFSLEQVLAYAELIKSHVLNIKAVPGMIHENDDVYPMVIDAIRKNAVVEYHEVVGAHHVHLMAPECIAGIISKFLLNPVAINGSATD